MKSTNTKRIGVNKWGSTWAGATRLARLPRRLTPRWSLPPTYYQKPKRGTGVGPMQVPGSGQSRYLIRTRLQQSEYRDRT
jgi:hypothetical protein